jgi:hypothetical protein
MPAKTVELAHHVDGRLRVYRGDQLLLALPLPLEEYNEGRPKLLTSAQKRKTRHRASAISPTALH